MKCRGISAGCILLAFAVAALPVSEAAEDEDFFPKRVRKAGKDSSHGKSVKGKKKSPKKEKESDDEEESESVEWGVTDRETWNKMQALNVPEARFEKTQAADFAAYLSKHLQDNQLSVSVKFHPEATSKPQPMVVALKVDNVTAVELLKLACHQMGCVYTVENGEIGLYDSQHLFTRTYAVTRGEIFGLQKGNSDLEAALRAKGVALPSKAKVSFNAAGDTLTAVSTAVTHEGLADMMQHFTEMREKLPKTVVLFKKYCSTVRKVGKAALKVKPGKSAAAKLKKLNAQLEKACSQEEEAALEYYMAVKPHEYKKLKKLVDELGESMQYTIDSFYEDETEAGEEAGNEASDIYANMIRFVE